MADSTKKTGWRKFFSVSKTGVVVTFIFTIALLVAVAMVLLIFGGSKTKNPETKTGVPAVEVVTPTPVTVQKPVILRSGEEEIHVFSPGENGIIVASPKGVKPTVYIIPGRYVGGFSLGSRVLIRINGKYLWEASSADTKTKEELREMCQGEYPNQWEFISPEEGKEVFISFSAITKMPEK
jgi:hypothetical protein